jgi:FtsP/CotA-like multicopper oxidase with cupredoxin domain
MAKNRRFSRRNVLKYSALGGAIVGGGYAANRYFNAPEQADVISALPLPIPPLMTGTKIEGKTIYNLTAQKGVSSFVKDQDTQTFGYNGNYLGPTISMQKGDDVALNVTNNLGEPTTVHWHGIHLPAKMDGGPHQTIASGETWQPEFKMQNEAATYFYHSHMMHKTDEQVYKGLAGMLIVHDSQSSLDLPDVYGVDDFPLIVQDKDFSANGDMNYSAAIEGVKGNTILANGANMPELEAPAQFVRLRLLNASNARMYNFGFSDNRSFHQIASDGGLLAKPVEMTRLLLSPAERGEILVDLSGQENTRLRLVSYSNEIANLTPFWAKDALDRKAFDILSISVGPSLPIATKQIPENLAIINQLSEQSASVTRQFELKMGLFSGSMTINGLEMDIDRIDHTVKLGDIEIWEISNPADLAHPFHIHDIQFQILARDGNPPPENERGWKDVVLVKKGETVRVIAQFNDFADPETPFMFHCHILEHEDNGMMGQFLVV